MLCKEDLEYFSEESNVSVDFVRSEIEEMEQFVVSLFESEPEVETNTAAVERLMAEFTERSEAAVVSYVRNSYLYASALSAVMYIIRHEDDWKNGVLPDFYNIALRQAKTAYKNIYGFEHILVYNILRLFKQTDFQGIIAYMRQVGSYIQRAKEVWDSFGSRYQQDVLYRGYERVCMQAGLYLCISDSNISSKAQIRLLRHLAKLNDREGLMRVYYRLYSVYLDMYKLPGGTDADYNPQTGYPYFEECLEKAYTIMGYTLENVDLNTYSGRIWLRAAIDYARIMTADGGEDSLIPYNPEEAERILRFASQCDFEDISTYAKHCLEVHFNE